MQVADREGANGALMNIKKERNKNTIYYEENKTTLTVQYRFKRRSSLQV